jgi:NADP-dependent 3-hydroxy acid dehydrogenase YdfG
MDVGVVALNAGISAGGPYAEFDEWQVESIVNVNALQVAFGTKAILPILLDRHA